MKVRVFLRTPLHRGRPTGGRQHELNATIIEVVGDAEVRDGGLELAVSELIDDRGESVESPWATIFLPTAKMDFYVLT